MKTVDQYKKQYRELALMCDNIPAADCYIMAYQKERGKEKVLKPIFQSPTNGGYSKPFQDAAYNEYQDACLRLSALHTLIREETEKERAVEDFVKTVNS